MKLKIREAVKSDYDDVSTLVKEVHRLHVEKRPDIYLDVDNPLLKERFDELLNSGTSKVFVVENIENREIIAYSIFQTLYSQNIHLIIPSKILFIDDFCVKSSYRGNGIGKLLFNYIVDYAKSEGDYSIHLTVSEFNKNAIKFYEEMGMSTRNRKMELIL